MFAGGELVATGSKTSWLLMLEWGPGLGPPLGPGKSVGGPVGWAFVAGELAAGAVTGTSDATGAALESSGDNKSLMLSRTLSTFVDGNGGSAG